MPEETPETPSPAAPEGATPPKPARAPRTKRTGTAAPKRSPEPAKEGAPAPAPAAPRAAETPSPPKVPPARAVAETGTVLDATGLVLGRAASLIAKRLLNGEHIVVVNAEHSVVTGDRAMVLETYRANRARGSKRTGPHFPRYPDRIFRRTVRGMLPHLKTRGQEAFERLEVHIGVPPALQGVSRQSLEGARARPALRRPITLQEISRLLGARV
jgi:large subunit ribosomal protein L13